jgi:DNA polymerase-3 subunit delta'
MSFKGILGHTKEIKALTKALNNGRVAHAYLFSGPEGVGKRRVARALAAALNCALFDGTDACGACEDCTAFESGAHQNLMEIGPTDKDGERARNGLIRIAEIRRLQETLRYKVGSGRKVAIVDSADRLMPGAANAFLKTLEEPPPDSVIMLLTSKATDLLPTILSRCQRINFRPLPESAIAELLSKDGVAGEDAVFAARLSFGSISTALKYARSSAYEVRRELTGRLGALQKGDTLEVMKLAEELAKRDDLIDVLEFLKNWLRDRLVTIEGAPGLATAGLGFAGGEGGAGKDRQRALIDSFAVIEEAIHDLTPPRYGNKLLTMESLLFRLVGLGTLG